MIPDALYGRAGAWIARFCADPFALLIVVLAGLGTVHILARTATYGAAVDWDSTIFLSTALNFLAGEGWRSFWDRPMVTWPPLFPLLLAAFGWVGIDPLEAGRWANAAAFGLTILAAGGWLRSNLRSRWLALAASVAILAALPLSDFASRVLTDPLFVLFTLLALIQLAAFLNRRTTAPLLWAAVFTALAALTRYPGVALIGTGVLILLPTARLKQTLIFGAISSVPLLAVLTRNWAVTGDLTRATGGRDPQGQSLFDTLGQTVDVFRTWIVPPNAPDGFAYLLGLAVATGVLAGATVVLRAARMHRDAAFRLGPALPFGAFALIYSLFIIAAVPLILTHIIDRYLLPIYVPLLLTAALLLDRFLSMAAAGWMVVIRYGLASLVLLGTLAHIGFSARENLRLTTQAYVVGYNGFYNQWSPYNTLYWQQSETLNYIRDNQIEGRIYSNNRALVWFVDRTANPKKHRILPRRMRWTEIEAGAHIVWLDRGGLERDFLGHDDLDLRVLPGMKIVAERADGLVLRRAAYEPFDRKRHRARKQRYVNELIQRAEEHVARAGWNVYRAVYRTGRKLIYRKAPCTPADVQAKFVLHVVPANPADLPPDRKQYDSDNLDFHFDQYGERFDDQCTVIAPLPDYAIDRIYIGQWIAEDNRTVWEAEFPPDQ